MSTTKTRDIITSQPGHHELVQASSRSLEQHPVTPESVRDSITSRLPAPGRLSVEFGRQDDTRAAVEAGPEAVWRGPLYGREDEPGVRETVAEEVRHAVLGLIPGLAQHSGISLARACTVMHDACQDSRREVERRRNEQEKALSKAERRLEGLGRQAPDGEGDSGSGIVGVILGKVAGFGTSVMDQAEAAERWTEREKALFRLDVQDANLYVWTALLACLQKLPAILQQAESHLKSELHNAVLFQSPDSGPGMRLPDVTWEPAAALAAYFTETEAAPLLPGQLLITLAEGRWSEVTGLIETASREQPAGLSLVSAMKALHTEKQLREGGTLILKVVKQDVQKHQVQAPMLYQLGEAGSGGQVHTLWPPVADQTLAAALEGAAPFLGYLVLEAPVTADAVRTSTNGDGIGSSEPVSEEPEPSLTANGRHPAAATL